MKKLLIKAAVLLVFATSLVSCKKYLDINTNPNAAKEIDPKLLFSFASVSFVNNRAGGDLYIPMALGGQSIASGGSSTENISWGSGGEDQYVFSPFSYGNIWTQYYTSVVANLYNAIHLAEAALPVNNNGAAQSKVVLAQTFYELSTIYGDIPFSESISDSVAAPHFDRQKDVFEGCLALLDEALAQFNPSSEESFTGDYDLFYRGDIEAWMKAARSLKLRILMTMVDADPSKAAAIGALVSAGGFISSTDGNMKISFEEESGKRNPKYAISEQYNDGIDFFYGTPEVIDFMNARNDPRLPFYFDKPGGEYVGIPAGEDADDAIHAKLASTLHTADAPEYIFTYQEQLFYEAEVYARGLGVAADLARADELYKKAIEVSATSIGVEPTKAADFAGGLPALAAEPDALAAIAYQHWIDKMDRGIDAFTQWRRSGAEGAETPSLTLPLQAPAGGLFRRYEYPAAAELNSNPNAPALEPFTIKMWFDL